MAYNWWNVTTLLDTDDSDHNSAGAVVGAVVGAFIGGIFTTAIIFIILIYYLYFYKNKRNVNYVICQGIHKCVLYSTKLWLGNWFVYHLL